MNNKKYVLTSESITFAGIKLFRIKALISFADVKAGDIGGFIEKEDNLKQVGNAWVYGNALVYGNAEVSGDADYMCVRGAGSCCRNTTFYRTEGTMIEVNCGCFHGTLNEFVNKVKATHGGTKYEKEYLAAVELVKIHFEIEEN